MWSTCSPKKQEYTLFATDSWVISAAEPRQVLVQIELLVF